VNESTALSERAVSAPPEPARGEGGRRSLAWQPFAVAALVLFATAVNLWWVYAHRRGLPLDIDEAGYMQRAVRDADALHHGGLPSLWSTIRLPDPQAPLLTAIAGVFRWIGGGGTYRLFAVEQLFYAVAVVATYLGSRRLMNRNWSLLAAVLVAAVPGVVSSSRTFWFALPAAAMVTATLAAQLHSDAFRSRWLSVLWGFLLGLSALARTVVLALLPMLIVAAIATVLVSRCSRRTRALNLGLGLGVSLVVAGSWYSATWRPVLHYLTQYGYGAQATHYGQGRSLFSANWWLFRINDVVNIELYAPLALALLSCFVAGLVPWVRRRSNRGERPVQRTWLSASVELGARFLRRPDAPAWFLVVGGYFVLSTSSNYGSMFELPLVPALCILAVAAASRSQLLVRPFLTAACLTAAALSFAGVSDAIPPVSSSSTSVSVGPVNLVVFDGRGTLLRYAAPGGNACPQGRRCGGAGATGNDEKAYLREWLGPSQTMASFLHGYAAAQSCDPVVFFGVEDPLFNTNTVDLDYQLTFGSTLPTGLIKPPRDSAEQPYEQLEDPARGIPNLVISGPVAPYNRDFSPTAAPGVERRALKRAGFAPVGRLSLPDGRLMTVWWNHRGPCGPGRP
jgi:4-amino-4-deoxy-L-arabinose transferase-like glycosyltransferase